MNQGTSTALERVPAGATSDGDGIVLGSGPVTVDAYVDFICPYCKKFEEEVGPTLRQMVAEGAISLVYHPMAFLDRLSTTRYSSRASAASACAADGGQFDEYLLALFANQPPEGGPGLSDDELIAVGNSIGLDGAAFGRCVREQVHLPWAAYVTERALALGVDGTPTVLVDGNLVPARTGTIAAAVASVLG